MLRDPLIISSRGDASEEQHYMVLCNAVRELSAGPWSKPGAARLQRVSGSLITYSSIDNGRSTGEGGGGAAACWCGFGYRPRNSLNMLLVKILFWEAEVEMRSGI